MATNLETGIEGYTGYIFKGYDFSEDECMVGIDYDGEDPLGGKGILVRSLPCYPDEVTSSVNATWNETTVIGRVGSINVYTSTSDVQTSFSFDLHRETPVIGNTNNSGNDIDYIVRLIKAGCYPSYENSGSTLKPPITTFKFGDMYISGRLTQVQETWKKPIVNGAYTLCTLSVSMTSAAKYIVDYRNIIGNAKQHNVKSVRGFDLW